MERLNYLTWMLITSSLYDDTLSLYADTLSLYDDISTLQADTSSIYDTLYYMIIFHV